VYENRALDDWWEHPECERCGGSHFSTLVYDRSHPEYHPGGSEQVCESCGARYGRWSHQLLHAQEAEKRYGHHFTYGNQLAKEEQ
jgi:hypothetical protein